MHQIVKIAAPRLRHVSTRDQDLRLQRAALKEAGYRRTFEEKVSGAKRDRPELARMLDSSATKMWWW